MMRSQQPVHYKLSVDCRCVPSVRTQHVSDRVCWPDNRIEKTTGNELCMADYRQFEKLPF